ncbi:MAG: SH3 domain-containing protein, partial [Chloroflexota bacterium]|nr:SH3 domain-containing protein [Chloroflexota bacterium]
MWNRWFAGLILVLLAVCGSVLAGSLIGLMDGPGGDTGSSAFQDDADLRAKRLEITPTLTVEVGGPTDAAVSPTGTSISPTPTSMMAAAATPPASSACTVQVNLNLRAGPGGTYPTQGVLQPGTDVIAMARSTDDSWVHVETSDNLVGWVAREFITCENLDWDQLLVAANPPTATPPPPPTATTWPSSTPITTVPTPPPSQNSTGITMRLEDTNWVGSYRRTS